jgi:hypothetical protein
MTVKASITYRHDLRASDFVRRSVYGKPVRICGWGCCSDRVESNG